MMLTDRVKVIFRYLLWGALIPGSVWFIWHQGYERGEADVRLEVANQKTQQAADSLNQFIAGTRQLTAQANQASTLLAQQINARQLADEKSTEAIREALKKNAASRVGCRFDADVMQELARAREQAATTATSGFTRPTGRPVSPTSVSGQ
ncbi:hypothetical protein JMI38_001794 [Salmonella enterica]|uniref:DUF2570 domain-containing protein n=1 Tax=Salmonella enterica TaxID=28901 RepID=A0A3K5RFI5_SALER|nr:hypothetical protein [Salmonella enterica]EAU5156197.1 hypothetical protein [Salmonella enterica]EAZ4795581.1 hypothetical protein [Salmonella enterica]EBA6828820.1 hypothetical protein [Salmonella enterica]EBI6116153.1 hypothetical protein [Salmonella enterica]